MTGERTFKSSEPSGNAGSRPVASFASRRRAHRFVYSHSQAVKETRAYLRAEAKYAAWLSVKVLALGAIAAWVAWTITIDVGKRVSPYLVRTDGVVTANDLRRMEAQKNQLDTLLDTQLPVLLETRERARREREERKAVRAAQIARVKAKVAGWFN